MKKLLCALAMLAVSATASANLVKNGDFSNGGTDWTLTGNTSYSNFDGGQWNDGAATSDAWLSQVIPTIASEMYWVRFDAEVNWDDITVAMDGTPLFSATSDGHYELSVVATADNATLSFITHNDPGYNHLDNVVVERAANVPEPASLVLIGLGLAGLGVLRRKRAA